MSSGSYPIEPPIQQSVNIIRFEIKVVELVLYTSVSLQAYLYDENNKIQQVKMYYLTGDDYNNWSNDDTYIVDYVKNHL